MLCWLAATQTELIANDDAPPAPCQLSLHTWRAVVDCVLMDTNHDGQVFNVTRADVPARKQDLVAGRYALPVPPDGATVAIKVIDMLGEEQVLVLRLLNTLAV